MSKTITKVIAALGVVAGLGVAVLPLASYAATDDVIIQVTIDPTGVSTPDCTGYLCDIPATNSGQVITIADKDGTMFSLCENTQTGCTTDTGSSNTSANYVIRTITSELASLTHGQGTGIGYGVKSSLTGTGAGGYVASGTSTTGILGGNWLPVSASIGTYTAATAVDTVELAISRAADWAVTNIPGTYTNTLSITTAALP